MAWILSGFADEAGDDPQVQIQTILDAGLRHIDPRGIAGENIVDYPADKTKAFKDQLDAAGISANMLGTPIGKIDIADDFQIDLDRLERVAKNGDILRCANVRIFSYYNKAGVPRDAWRAESLRRLKALKKRAADLGLVLFNENEHKLLGETCAQIVDLAGALRDGGTFKTIFDFDNFNQVGDDLWDTWLQLRDVTDAFHLKDSDANCQHVPFGQGAGQARKILADALERGWSGSLSMEPHLAHSPAVMATGPSGQANQSLADLSHSECWQVGAAASKQVLDDIGAVY